MNIIDILIPRENNEIIKALYNMTPYQILYNSIRFGYLPGVIKIYDEHNKLISWYSIVVAAEYGQEDILDFLLEHPRYNIDPTYCKNLAICNAKKNGHQCTVDRLLKDKRVIEKLTEEEYEFFRKKR